jgi:hypothetical protein
MGKLVVAVLLTALVSGCSLQMGNTKLGIFEGWNQPTTTQTDKSVSKSEPVSSQK